MRVVQQNQIYQLSFLPRFFPVNCFLVEEQKDLTLVDAALPYSAQGIIRVAQQIGKPIKRIVLTHAHADHVGALDELKHRLPDAQVYISKRDARLLAGDVSLDEHEPRTPIKGGIPKGVRTKPDILLEDGDQIESLLAIATPGHTPGSMSFLDQRNQALIVGDAVQLRGGVAVSGQLKPLFPFPALATWSKEHALESVKRLLKYQPSLLAVGHGSMLMNPGQKLTIALQQAQQNLMIKE